jgi:DNA-binding MarR family transcriptional regulator
MSDATIDERLMGSELLSAVGQLHRWATRHTALPLSQSLARLLAQIEELEPSRIGDLARADNCSQPTMTTQVQKLEEQGLVSRAADPADARAVLIGLTSAGRVMLRDMREARAAALAPVLDALSSDDQRTLRASIEVFARMLDPERDAR